jgi:hypothetical protein
LHQLPRGVVQDRYVRARRREDRTLLPAARGEAEDVGAPKIREPPGSWYGSVLRQQDLSLVPSGGLDDVRGDGDDPLVAALNPLSQASQL